MKNESKSYLELPKGHFASNNQHTLGSAYVSLLNKAVPTIAWLQDLPVIDLLMLRRLDSLDATGVLTKKLITMFLDFAPNAIATIKRLATENRSEEFHRQIHSLKSSSANLGAARMASVLQHLEAKLNLQTTEVPSLVEVLEYEYAHVQQTLLEMR